MYKLLLIFILISCSVESQKFDINDIDYKRYDSVTSWYLIRSKSTQKWGFIDKENEIKIPVEYYDLFPFQKTTISYALKNNKYGFINTKNEVIVPFQYESNKENRRIYSAGLMAVNKEGKFGFVNENGKLIVSLKYDEVDYFRPNGLCAVTKGGKSGFINKLGEEIIPIIYPDVNQQMKDQNVIVKKNNKWAVFDNSGKQLSDFIYDNVKRTDISDFSKDIFTRDQSTYFENGAALVEINGKYEFINAKAQAAFPNNKFDSASVFNTFKNAIVKRNGKYGIIKIDGTFKVPLEYDFIGYFDTNHAFSEYYNAKKGKIYSILNRDLKKIGESYEPVYNDFSTSDLTLTYKNLKGKYGIVDWQGNTMIPFEYNDLREIEDTPFLWAKKGDFYGVISEKGQTKIPVKYKKISSIYDKFDDQDQINKFLFIADGMVIDINNQIIINEYDTINDIFYNHNKLIVSKNKKFGIIDINKKNLLPLEYDEISNWVEYGPEKRHFIKKNGKYGLIEYENFKIIIPPIYDKFDQRENLIFVTKNGKSGILDLNNKIICPFIFDDVRPHKYFGYDDGKNKTFYSKKGKKFFQITYEGKIEKEISEKEFKNNTEHQNM